MPNWPIRLGWVCLEVMEGGWPAEEPSRFAEELFKGSCRSSRSRIAKFSTAGLPPCFVAGSSQVMESEEVRLGVWELRGE